MVNSRRDFAIKLGTLGGVAASVAILPRPAKAQSGVQVRAELSESETVVGEGVVLQVEVSQQGSDDQAKAGVPQIKELPGIEIQGRGTSFSTSSVFRNGQMSMVRSQTHNFVILPSKAGKFSFEVQVPVGGKQFKPKRTPVLLVKGSGDVTASESEASEEQVIVEDAGASAGAKPNSSKQEIILWPTVDRGQVYVGEQLIYRFEVWDRSRSSIEMAVMPTFKDFWTEELQAGEQRADYAGGHRYRVQTVLMRALFPQHSGKLVIGGAEARISQSPLDALFGRRRRRRKPQKIRGKNLTVEVLPLPAEGQPADFSANNVGRFSVTTRLDRDRVKQGDGLTLHVEIEGRGNIRVVELAEFPKIEGVRSYDPKPELPEFDVVQGRVGGKRSYKILLIAERPGTITVPAHVLDYFDPVEKKYRRSSSKILQFEVEAREGMHHDSSSDGQKEGDGHGPQSDSSGQKNGDGVVADNYEGEVDPLAEPIDRLVDDRVAPRRAWLSGGRWMAGMLAPPVLWASAWGGIALYRKLGPSESTKQRANRRAKLEALHRKASEALEDGTGFYPALGELLHRVAMEKAGSEGLGLPRHRLVELLLRKGVAKDQVDQWKEILDRCDAARFASVQEDLSRRKEALELVETLMHDRNWSIT